MEVAAPLRRAACPSSDRGLEGTVRVCACVSTQCRYFCTHRLRNNSIFSRSELSDLPKPGPLLVPPAIAVATSSLPVALPARCFVPERREQLPGTEGCLPLLRRSLPA